MTRFSEVLTIVQANKLNFPLKPLCVMDIDGTLVSAGGTEAEIDPAIITEIQGLKHFADVVLCSNKKNFERDRNMAAKLGVGHIESRLHKPNPKILDGYISDTNRPSRIVVVVGDKYLTDGLLARRVGGYFVRVKRFVGPKESLLDRVYNRIDDIAGIFLKGYLS